MTASASPARNRRGAIAMMAAMAAFVCNDVLMKLAREAYPSGQAILLRSVFAVMISFGLVLLFKEASKLPLGLRRPVLLRAAIEAALALAYVWALGMMPIGNLTAISLVSPIMIVVLAVLLRIERVGWRRGLAIIVGFCGVLLVVRPSREGFDAASLAALACAALVSVRELVTRGIGADIPSSVISLTTTVIVGIVAAGFGLSEDWVPIARIQTLYVATAALLVAIGMICIVTAYRDADVGVVSGLRYSVVIFAVILGYLVWGDIPDLVAVAGIVLIVGSGLYAMHRQRVKPDSALKLNGRTEP